MPLILQNSFFSSSAYFEAEIIPMGRLWIKFIHFSHLFLCQAEKYRPFNVGPFPLVAPHLCLCVEVEGVVKVIALRNKLNAPPEYFGLGFACLSLLFISLKYFIYIALFPIEYICNVKTLICYIFWLFLSCSIVIVNLHVYAIK